EIRHENDQNIVLTQPPARSIQAGRQFESSLLSSVEQATSGLLPRRDPVGFVTNDNHVEIDRLFRLKFRSPHGHFGLDGINGDDAKFTGMESRQQGLPAIGPGMMVCECQQSVALEDAIALAEYRPEVIGEPASIDVLDFFRRTRRWP